MAVMWDMLAGLVDAFVPIGGSIISVDILQGGPGELFAQRRSDVRVKQFLSDKLLTAYPDFAATALLASDRNEVVSTVDGECWVQPTVMVGPGLVWGRQVAGRVRDIRKIIDGLRNVSLLYLAPCPGHGKILQHILPVLRDRGIVVLWALSGSSGTIEGDVLQSVASDGGLAVYRFDANGSQLGESATAAVAFSLLVPRVAWTPYGLDELGSTSSAPLVVSASRGHCIDLLDRLPAERRVRLAQPIVEKQFLSIGSHVLADAGEFVERDGVRYMQVGRRRTLTFVFAASMSGVVDVGLVLGNWTSRSHVASLRIDGEGIEARLTWVDEWCQLRIGTPFAIRRSLGPVTFTLRDLRPGDGPGEHLLIKGIEIASRLRTDIPAIPLPALKLKN